MEQGTCLNYSEVPHKESLVTFYFLFYFRVIKHNKILHPIDLHESASCVHIKAVNSCTIARSSALCDQYNVLVLCRQWCSVSSQFCFYQRLRCGSVSACGDVVLQWRGSKLLSCLWRQGGDPLIALVLYFCDVVKVPLEGIISTFWTK